MKFLHTFGELMKAIMIIVVIKLNLTGMTIIFFYIKFLHTFGELMKAIMIIVVCLCMATSVVLV